MVKVAVVGAAGGIGQPLSLLLKLNPVITHLSLYDIVNVPGVAADISHINTPAQVTSHMGADNLHEALKDAHLVVIPAGVPRKPGMTRDDLFRINAGIVRDLAEAAAKACPKAFMLIISNPVNSTTPIVAEVFKAHGVFDPRKIFGVTTLDSVRASTFVSSAVGGQVKPHEIRLPVVGGHSGATIVPLFSLAQPSVQNLSESQIQELTNRVQYGGDEVVKAKGGAGSATLSMAQAGARFVNSLLDASVSGKSNVVEAGFVSLEADPDCKEAQKFANGASFFAFDLQLSARGVEKFNVPQSITQYESRLVDDAVAELVKSINKGIDFVKGEAGSKL